MIATLSFCDGRSTCTCGTTGCPTTCQLSSTTDSYNMFYEYDPSAMKDDPPKKKYKGEDLSFLYNSMFVSHVLYYKNRLYQRKMFSKSGYLPKRIRRIRKSKHSE